MYFSKLLQSSHVYVYFGVVCLTVGCILYLFQSIVSADDYYLYTEV